MSRKLGKRKRFKLSRDAKSPDEIFPGRLGPIKDGNTQRTMTAILDVLKEAFPEQDFTLFVAERHKPGQTTLPRFNYMSTCHREDMLAVLKAFIAKNEATGDLEKAEKINEAPPTAAKN